MGALDRDALLKRAERQVLLVDLGGDETITIMELMGSDRDEYEHFVQTANKKNWRGIRAKLAQLSIINGDGKLMFNPSELNVVGEMSATVLDRVFMAAMSFNMLEDVSLEKARKKS